MAIFRVVSMYCIDKTEGEYRIMSERFSVRNSAICILYSIRKLGMKYDTFITFKTIAAR